MKRFAENMKTFFARWEARGEARPAWAGRWRSNRGATEFPGRIMKSIRAKTMLLAAKVAVLAVFLYWVIRTQDLKMVAMLLGNISVKDALLFMAIDAIGVFLSSVNLFILLRAYQIRISFQRLLYYDVLATAGFYYTPGGLGGVGVLTYFLVNEGVGKGSTAAVLLVDRLIGGLVSLLFIGALLVVSPMQWQEFGWRAETLLALFSLAGLAGAAILISRRLREILVKLWIKVSLLGSAKKLLLANFGITALIFLSSGVKLLICVLAVGASVKDWQVIVFSYGVFPLLGYLPITFGGFGVTESVSVVLWGKAGLLSEQSIAAMIVVRFLTMCSTLGLVATAHTVRKFVVPQWGGGSPGAGCI